MSVKSQELAAPKRILPKPDVAMKVINGVPYLQLNGTLKQPFLNRRRRTRKRKAPNRSRTSSYGPNKRIKVRRFLPEQIQPVGSENELGRKNCHGFEAPKQKETHHSTGPVMPVQAVLLEEVTCPISGCHLKGDLWKHIIQNHVEWDRVARNKVVVEETEFFCTHCFETGFTTVYKCLQHENSMHGTNTENSCTICGFTSCHSFEYCLHIVRSHGLLFHCPTCREEFCVRADLESHMSYVCSNYVRSDWRQDRYFCPFCNARFVNETETVDHLFQKFCAGSSDKNKQFKCSSCELKFETLDSLKHHSKHSNRCRCSKYASNDGRFQCYSCKVAFESVEALTFHQGPNAKRLNFAPKISRPANFKSQLFQIICDAERKDVPNCPRALDSLKPNFEMLLHSPGKAYDSVRESSLSSNIVEQETYFEINGFGKIQAEREDIQEHRPQVIMTNANINNQSGGSNFIILGNNCLKDPQLCSTHQTPNRRSPDIDIPAHSQAGVFGGSVSASACIGQNLIDRESNAEENIDNSSCSALMNGYQVNAELKGLVKTEVSEKCCSQDDKHSVEEKQVLEGHDEIQDIVRDEFKKCLASMQEKEMSSKALFCINHSGAYLSDKVSMQALYGIKSEPSESVCIVREDQWRKKEGSQELAQENNDTQLVENKRIGLKNQVQYIGLHKSFGNTYDTLQREIKSEPVSPPSADLDRNCFNYEIIKEHNDYFPNSSSLTPVTVPTDCANKLTKNSAKTDMSVKTNILLNCSSSVYSSGEKNSLKKKSRKGKTHGISSDKHSIPQTRTTNALPSRASEPLTLALSTASKVTGSVTQVMAGQVATLALTTQTISKTVAKTSVYSDKPDGTSTKPFVTLSEAGQRTVASSISKARLSQEIKASASMAMSSDGPPVSSSSPHIVFDKSKAKTSTSLAISGLGKATSTAQAEPVQSTVTESTNQVIPYFKLTQKSKSQGSAVLNAAGPPLVLTKQGKTTGLEILQCQANAAKSGNGKIQIQTYQAQLFQSSRRNSTPCLVVQTKPGKVPITPSNDQAIMCTKKSGKGRPDRKANRKVLNDCYVKVDAEKPNSSELKINHLSSQSDGEYKAQNNDVEEAFSEMSALQNILSCSEQARKLKAVNSSKKTKATLGNKRKVEKLNAVSKCLVSLTNHSNMSHKDKRITDILPLKPANLQNDCSEQNQKHHVPPMQNAVSRTQENVETDLKQHLQKKNQDHVSWIQENKSFQSHLQPSGIPKNTSTKGIDLHVTGVQSKVVADVQNAVPLSNNWQGNLMFVNQGVPIAAQQNPWVRSQIINPGIQGTVQNVGFQPWQIPQQPQMVYQSTQQVQGSVALPQKIMTVNHLNGSQSGSILVVGQQPIMTTNLQSQPQLILAGCQSPNDVSAGKQALKTSTAGMQPPQEKSQPDIQKYRPIRVKTAEDTKKEWKGNKVKDLKNYFASYISAETLPPKKVIEQYLISRIGKYDWSKMPYVTSDVRKGVGLLIKERRKAKVYKTRSLICWTCKEDLELLAYFADHVKNLKCPGTTECLQAKEQMEKMDLLVKRRTYKAIEGRMKRLIRRCRMRQKFHSDEHQQTLEKEESTESKHVEELDKTATGKVEGKNDKSAEERSVVKSAESAVISVEEEARECLMDIYNESIKEETSDTEHVHNESLKEETSDSEGRIYVSNESLKEEKSDSEERIHIYIESLKDGTSDVEERLSKESLKEEGSDTMAEIFPEPVEKKTFDSDIVIKLESEEY